MPTVDLSSFHQASGTGADGTKFDNLIDAVQSALNGLDNNNIAANAGIVVSKLSAPYTAFTPVWTCSGTAPALGNASVVTRYLQIGKLVHYYGIVVFGTTSTFGTGTFSFSLPVTALTAVARSNGHGDVFHSATSARGMVTAETLTSTTFSLTFGATYLGTATPVGQTTPWTWASADFISWNLLYEAA